jgi:hypothetical protein
VRERERDKKEKEQAWVRGLCGARRRGEGHYKSYCKVHDTRGTQQIEKQIHEWMSSGTNFIQFNDRSGKSLVVDFDWIWTQREDVKVEREGERGGREVDSVSRYGLSVSLFRFLSHTHRHPREAGFPATPSPFFAATAMPCHVICVGSLAGKQSRCAIFHLGPRGFTLQRLTWGWRGQTGSSDLRDESVSTGLASSGGMMTGKRRWGLGSIGQVGAGHEVGQRSAIPRRSQVDERPADGSR